MAASLHHCMDFCCFEDRHNETKITLKIYFKKEII